MSHKLVALLGSSIQTHRIVYLIIGTVRNFLVCSILGGQWTFIKGDISDKNVIDKIFSDYKPSVVVNLAAQAGVRYSITNPDAYVQSNLIGFYNILEACRHSYDNGETGVEHLVYASSSSVYGTNKKVTDHQAFLFPLISILLWTHHSNCSYCRYQRS